MRSVSMHSHFHIPHLKSLPSLALHRLLAGTGEQFLILFGAIFIFESLRENLFLYFLIIGLTMLVRLPALPFLAPFLTRIGLRSSIIIGIFMNLIRAGFLGAIVLSPSLPPVPFIVGSLVFLSLFNSFYWAPFHDEFSSLSSHKNRGSALSTLFVFQMVVNALVPVLSGYLIADFSYLILFILAAVFSLLSLIPLLRVPNERPTYPLSFRETFRILFTKKHRGPTLACIGEGFESGVLGGVWPVFIFLILSGNVIDVGLFSGALILLQILIQLLAGRSIDHGKAKSYSVASSFWDSASWVVRAFFISPIGAFISTTLHSFTHTVFRTSIHAIFYDARSDGGHYCDELTVLRELGLNIGRTIFFLLAAPLSFFLPLQYFFLFAAFGVLLNVYWKDVLIK